MKITLTTRHKTATSTFLNSQLLQYLPNFEISNEISKNADIQLFMGYDPRIDEARHINNKAIIGIIDPRPGSEQNLVKADFYLANGVEMVNYFASSNSEHFIYPIYPPLDVPFRKSLKKNISNKIVIGYHGNRAHLDLMIDSVCPALEKLSKSRNLVFNAIYNISQLGKWNWQPKSRQIEINNIQWSEEAYTKSLSNCDIGIVPNLIPFDPPLSTHEKQLMSNNLAFDSDLKFRFKPTSNVGRILVFAQLGIPVIADMFPSSAEIIQHGKNGFLASNKASWYNALRDLSESYELRLNFSKNLHEVFQNHYHWGIKNKELLHYFERILKTNKKP